INQCLENGRSRPRFRKFKEKRIQKYKFQIYKLNIYGRIRHSARLLKNRREKLLITQKRIAKR
ncbi:hypothetical protein BpHYR1_022449, partial [Brachionus plicatilis]